MTYTEPKLSFPVDTLTSGVRYRARVRVLSQSFLGIWSEWSPSITWYNREYQVLGCEDLYSCVYSLLRNSLWLTSGFQFWDASNYTSLWLCCSDQRAASRPTVSMVVTDGCHRLTECSFYTVRNSRIVRTEENCVRLMQWYC